MAWARRWFGERGRPQQRQAPLHSHDQRGGSPTVSVHIDSMHQYVGEKGHSHALPCGGLGYRLGSRVAAANKPAQVQRGTGNHHQQPPAAASCQCRHWRAIAKPWALHEAETLPLHYCHTAHSHLRAMAFGMYPIAFASSITSWQPRPYTPTVARGVVHSTRWRAFTQPNTARRGWVAFACCIIFYQ